MAAVLGLLLLLVGEVTGATATLTGGPVPGRPNGGVVDQPAGHGEHSHGPGTTALPAEVDAVLGTAGAVAALDRLDKLVAGAELDGNFLHELVHEVGRRS